MLALIRRIFLLLVRPTLVRYGTLPTSADTVAAAAVQLTSAAGAWTWGAWTQIAATVGTSDTQIKGITLENFIGAASEGEVEIGSGLGGFEVALARIQASNGYVTFNPAVLVLGGVRVAARYRTSTGAADNVSVKLMTATGM